MTETLTFRGPQVCSLAGVTYRQLDWWCRRGIVRPFVDARGSGTQRLFSLRDACVVWVLGQLSSLAGACPMPDLGVLDSLAEWAGWLVIHAGGVEHVTDPDLLALWPVAFIVNLGTCPLVPAPAREEAVA